MTDHEALQKKLRAAMKYAHDVCVLGATNRIEDVRHTNAWSFSQQYRYDPTGKYVNTVKHPENKLKNYYCNAAYDEEAKKGVLKKSRWHYEVDDVIKGRFCHTPICIYSVANKSPLEDAAFSVANQHVEFFVQVIRAIAVRSGNCGVQSRLVIKHLWEHPDGIERLELIAMENYDHAFVVVNRSGDLFQPDTWGDAWIIDPWANGGMIYPASELMDKLREIYFIAMDENADLKAAELLPQPGDFSNLNYWRCVADIRPQKDAYPTYDKNMKVEDYYVYNDFRYSPDNDIAQKAHAVIKGIHELKFDDCLQDIQHHRFFKKAKLNNAYAVHKYPVRRTKP